MKNKNKKNTFKKPELEIIEFTNDDIITESGAFGDPTPGNGDVFPNGWWGNRFD